METKSKIHPNIKHVPPMGVIAPRKRNSEPSIANKYKDPQKKINPKEKNLHAITTKRCWQFLYSTVDAINMANA